MAILDCGLFRLSKNGSVSPIGLSIGMPLSISGASAICASTSIVSNAIKIGVIIHDFFMCKDL
ncbi:MAG: hypothetical protein ACI9FU_000458 [Granulosicoccus sp.]|jgi:hypothetical protein